MRASARARAGILLGVALLSVGISVGAEVPLRLSADEIFVSSEQDHVEAAGSVEAALEEFTLAADDLTMRRTDDGSWSVVATGGVRLEFEDSLSLTGDRLAAVLRVGDDGARPASLEADGFGGRSRFVNELGEEHTLYFIGETGTVAFDDEGEVSLIEVRDVEVTTCDCCGVSLRAQPYALRADRLLLYPDRLVVVFGLTARLGGVPAFWLPVYAQPLEETLESPLFPAFGRSALRGWFLKWSVPFFVSESLFGSILLDYYSAHDEVGAGVVAHYDLAGHQGRLRVYRLPAKVGDSVLEISASHALPAGDTWSGEGSVDYRVVGPTTELDYGARAQGSSDGWTVVVSAAREVDQRNTNDEDPTNDVTKTTDRIPELSISRDAWSLGGLSIRPDLELGRVREQVGDDPSIDATRLAAGLDASIEPIVWRDLTLAPTLSLRASAYLGDEIAQSQGVLHIGTTARWRTATATHDLVLVRGGSPFEFDAEVAAHSLGLSIRRSGRATLTLSSGIDLSTGIPDPLRADLGWELWAVWSLYAEYDLSLAALDSVRLDGDWSSDALRLTWSVPYDAADAEFGRIRGTLEAPGEWLDLGIEATFFERALTVETDLDAELALDPIALTANVVFTNLSLSEMSLAAEASTEAGWGAKVAWMHEGGVPSWDDVRYGLFRDLGGCLRIGIEREASDTWVYLSILAFPEAIVRYAPATSRLKTGS